MAEPGELNAHSTTVMQAGCTLVSGRHHRCPTHLDRPAGSSSHFGLGRIVSGRAGEAPQS
jgi:hypothetical protein